MDIASFIEEIKKRPELRDIVHHEEIPARESSCRDPMRPLDERLRGALLEFGIPGLYTHQSEGIDLIREGRHVVIMTPTSSGKSLVYNIPVLESVLEDPSSRALYIFPLKGLEQDQLRAFNAIAERLPLMPVTAAAKRTRQKAGLGPCEIYDGDTSDYKRKKIREAPPNVILTNPDMLHLAIIPFHQKWEAFLKNLKYVVIDEIHAYRGVFGSHVAHVLRRLQRVLEKYGAAPQFIACSATIANPAALAGMLTGAPFELVSRSGAPEGKKHFLFINPRPGTSPYSVASRLFTMSVERGLKAIAFTKARKITELLHKWVKEGHPELNNLVSSYRAGFLPEERRSIEQRLFSGELIGVISTSALELGVDIGGLDVCVLAGYPGTVSSTWQRGGRAGRKGRDSLIALVAISDALDQYFMRHPEDFFKRNVEAAVIDAANEPVTKAHLLCAASEGYLKPGDKYYDTKTLSPLLHELEDEGKLRHWATGDIWYPRRKYPHREISIREIGAQFMILSTGGKLIGEASSSRVLHELHEGAVYLHRGTQWVVKNTDLPGRKVWCAQADELNYYTAAITDEETEIISVDDTIELGPVSINLGKLRVTEKILGYWRKNIFTRENLGEFALELPPSVFTTTGVWMKVDEDILDEVKSSGFGVPGALHALEHAQIAALPLYALCDRMDLGGVSYPFNDELGSPAIFIYDGHEGGVGLAKRGFELVDSWFASALKLMSECKCEISCPSCTQDPKCGNGNDPLDKRGAVMILKKWLNE